MGSVVREMGVNLFFYCNGCGSKFVEPGFKDKSYSGKVILEALKYYALGYSLEQSSKNLINGSKSILRGIRFTTGSENTEISVRF